MLPIGLALDDTRMTQEVRSSVPAITGFTILRGETDAKPSASVSHAPGLDSFVGLRAAKETQTWRAEHVKDGWLLDTDPSRNSGLPQRIGCRDRCAEMGLYRAGV